MAPFPFLNLPQLAQKVVVNHIELVTAIKLSIVSKKFGRVLQQTKITVEELEYSLKEDSFSLTIGTPTTDCLKILPSFTKLGTTKIRIIGGDYLNIIQVTENGRETKMLLKSKENTDESKLEELEKITAYLLKFLKVKNFDLVIRTNIDILNLFIWKYTKRFETLVLSDKSFDSLEVTPDKLKLLLEGLTADFLYLNVRTKENSNFKYLPANQKPSKIREIKIITSDWLEHDSLLNMAQEAIRCTILKGFSKKANAIIKKWISGENEQLEHLTLRTSGFRDRCNQEEILLGINAKPSIFKLEEIEKRCDVFESSFIKDIQREHDGCQATIVINDYWVELLVWNEKYLKAIGRM